MQRRPCVWPHCRVQPVTDTQLQHLSPLSHSKRQCHTYWLTLMIPLLLLSYLCLLLLTEPTQPLTAIQQRYNSVIHNDFICRIHQYALPLVTWPWCKHTKRINDEPLWQSVCHVSLQDVRRRTQGSRDPAPAFAVKQLPFLPMSCSKPEFHPGVYIMINPMLWIVIRQDDNDICQRRWGRLAFLTALSDYDVTYEATVKYASFSTSCSLPTIHFEWP